MFSAHRQNQLEMSLVTGRTNPAYFCHCIRACACVCACVWKGVLLLRAENQREDKTIQAILSILSLGDSQRHPSLHELRQLFLILHPFFVYFHPLYILISFSCCCLYHVSTICSLSQRLFLSPLVSVPVERMTEAVSAYSGVCSM